MYDRENDFEVVPMSKRELAQMFAPDLMPHSATNRLMSWVNNHPVLLKELLETGYRKHLRMLTAMQVQIIIKYLGAP